MGGLHFTGNWSPACLSWPNGFRWLPLTAHRQLIPAPRLRDSNADRQVFQSKIFRDKIGADISPAPDRLQAPHE